MAECTTPFGVWNAERNLTIAVPCGKCPNCIARRTSSWSFRLMQEEKVSYTSFFLTLTYDTKHVPIQPSGYMSVDYRHTQLFLKRLRKKHETRKQELGEFWRPIKYYLVGEYGTKTNRPHYHLLLYNAVIGDLQPAWTYGSIFYGKVSGASIGYTLKYLSKRGRIPMHDNDDRVPEQARMSKGWGQLT